MNKTTLSSAIAAYLAVAATPAHAIDVPINNMEFAGTNYEATGTLSDTTNNFGLMESVEDFFSNPWAAAGVAYFEPGIATTFDNDLVTDQDNITNGTVPLIFDDPLVNGTFSQTATDGVDDGMGGTTYTWSGNADQLPSAGGTDFSYDFTLQPNEIAWGTLFNWNGNAGIPVLVILDCISTPGVCSGRGTPMATGPFAGAAPAFSGGITPLACPDTFVSTEPDTPVTIPKTDLTSGCSGGLGAKIVTADGTSTEGGSISDNGTTLTYAPLTGFTGSDSFNYTVADDIFSTIPTQRVQVGGELQNNFSMLDRSGKVFGGTNDVDIVWDESTFNTNAVDANNTPTDTTFDIMTIASPEPFFNFNWVAHNVRIFSNIGGTAPLGFEFDVTCRKADYEAGTVDCDKPLSEQGALRRFMNMTLQPGQVGAHILFDWGKVDGTTPCGLANCDIDVVNVYDIDALWDNHGDAPPKNAVWIGPAGVPPATTENAPVPATWGLVSTDFNGDGINASPMIDGAFEGSYANFNYKPDKAGTALPPYTGEITDVEVDGFSFSLWSLVAGLFSVAGLRRFKAKK